VRCGPPISVFANELRDNDNPIKEPAAHHLFKILH